MHIALWDIDPFTGSTARFTDLGWTPHFVSPAECGGKLLDGEVDVALVPSIELLHNAAAYSVLSGTAFASRRGFPHVALKLNRPVHEVRTVLCSDKTEPFYGLAAIVLREQYESKTSLVRSGDADSELLMYGDEAVEGDQRSRIDLGLEWFEMTGTPLSWGFFSVRPGTTPTPELTAVQELLATLLRDDGSRTSQNGSDAGVAGGTSIRVMFDPEVSEGVDELAHYLFYVGILDDIPALRLMAGQN